MDTNATGRFIAELRKEKGYTQKELADRLMVTEKAISRWETGKGLPNTGILKPLSDELEVSVGELLAGERLEEFQIKEKTDRIILDSLNYSWHMLASIGRVIVRTIGVAFLISPMFLAGNGYLWIVGIIIVALELVYGFLKRRGYSMRITNKTYYLFAVILQMVALVLEILPIGVVMVFATGPDERVTEVVSHFSLLAYGYGNFSPMLTGILTVVVIILGIVSLTRFENAFKFRKSAFICSVIAVLLSLIPLLLFGTISMTAASYIISGAIFLSVCLQAVANRKESLI